MHERTDDACVAQNKAIYTDTYKGLFTRVNNYFDNNEQ